MKIALVVHTAYPEFIGGREHHVHNLASALSQTDNVVVIAGGKAKTIQRKTLSGYGLITLPMTSIKVSHNPLQIYRIVRKLFSALKEEKPDLIHAFEYGSYSTDIAYLYSQRYNIPFVLTVYGYQFRSFLIKFFKRFYDYCIGKHLFNKAEKIFCPSDVQRQEILEVTKAKNTNGKVVLQENCIKISDYENILIKYDLLKKYNLTDEVKLLTVARILPRKGIKYLILALDKVIRQYKFKNIKLIIVGPDCGELNNISHIIRKLRLENNIIIVGSVPYYRIKDFFGICDIFALPSLYEGSPLALLEAMAAGKAVIFSDLSCARNIIKDGENGLLVKPADIDSLSEAILRLSNDRRLRESFGLNAKEKVKNFDSLVEAQRVRKIYAGLLNNEQVP